MDITKLIKYIEDGLSTYDIAKFENLGQTTIRYWLNKYNLKTKQYDKNKERICSICGRVFKYKRKSGHGLVICNSCNVRIFRHKRKKYLVDLKGGKYSICGYNKNIKALDFHHLDPKIKDFSISAMFGKKSLEELVKEVDKCILVCRNCHMELHDEVV